MIYRRIFHTIKPNGIGPVRQCRTLLLSGCDNEKWCARAFSSHDNNQQQQQKQQQQRKQQQPLSSSGVDPVVRSFNEMPTARQWPLIGNRIDLLMTGWRNDFHEYIDRRHRQLGPIFREQLGPVEAVFIMAPNTIRELFLYEGKYPMHPLPEAWNLYNRVHECKRGLFFMDGEEWLTTRRALMPLLFQNDRRFYVAVEQMTEMLIDDWLAKAATTSCREFVVIDDLLTNLYRWSIDIIMGVMFGNAASRIIAEQRDAIEHLARSVHAVFDSSAPLAAIPPQLARRFNLKCWQTFENNVSDSLTIATRVIEHGMALGEADGLLRDMHGIQMSDELIKKIFIDLILAAGDTTAFTVQWALYELSQNNELQREIRAEIKQTEAQETPLVKGCVREAMRMYPVATFIGRIIGTDAVLDHFHVDKYTLVLISMFSAGRDPLSFPEPNIFMPSRWIRDPNTNQLHGVVQAQSSVPYALGARNCIGQKIANIQMRAIISKILKHFNLKLFNVEPIKPIMRLVVVPSHKLQLGIRKID